MGSIKSLLDEKGRAFVDVIITPSSLFLQVRKELRKKEYKGRALIDTGASCSSIDLDVAKSLGLISKGVVEVNSPKGQHDHHAYDIDLFIGMEGRLLLLENKIVVASDIKKQGIHMLIGTDIIKLGRLVFEKGKYFEFII